MAKTREEQNVLAKQVNAFTLFLILILLILSFPSSISGKRNTATLLRRQRSKQEPKNQQPGTVQRRYWQCRKIKCSRGGAR